MSVAVGFVVADSGRGTLAAISVHGMASHGSYITVGKSARAFSVDWDLHVGTGHPGRDLAQGRWKTGTLVPSKSDPNLLHEVLMNGFLCGGQDTNGLACVARECTLRLTEFTAYPFVVSPEMESEQKNLVLSLGDLTKVSLHPDTWYPAEIGLPGMSAESQSFAFGVFRFDNEISSGKPKGSVRFVCEEDWGPVSGRLLLHRFGRPIGEADLSS